MARSCWRRIMPNYHKTKRQLAPPSTTTRRCRALHSCAQWSADRNSSPGGHKLLPGKTSGSSARASAEGQTQNLLAICKLLAEKRVSLMSSPDSQTSHYNANNIG